MTDDRRIPHTALVLGLAGLIPFLWSAATHLSPALGGWAGSFLPPMFIGAYVGLTYGTVILAFMSGALWGFAARTESGVMPYAVSTVPALWVFFTVSDATTNSSIYLCAGFLGLLAVDASFATQGLAPRWWVRLRLPLTLVAVACLAIPVFT